MAFVQAVLETGGFFTPTSARSARIQQLRRHQRVTAGSRAMTRMRPPRRCFATPQIGVRNHIHLLRGYLTRRRGLTDRLRMPPPTGSALHRMEPSAATAPR
jgi:hypothetical protein